MKLREIIDNLDKSNPETWFGYEFCQDLEIYFTGNLIDHGFSVYTISRWLCTDTYVGMQAIFYKDELVCISNQTARKSNPNYMWVSKEAKLKIQAVIMELYEGDTDIELINFDEEMGEGYSVTYGSNFTSDDVILSETGERWKVVKKYTRYEDIDNWRTLIIERDGIKYKVDTKDILVPYNVV